MILIDYAITPSSIRNELAQDQTFLRVADNDFIPQLTET